MATEVPWIEDPSGDRIRSRQRGGLVCVDTDVGRGDDSFVLRPDAAKQLRDQLDAALAEVEGGAHP